MKCMVCKGGPDDKKCCCGSNIALLVLRLALAVIFIYHGADKLFGATGIDGFTAMLQGLGFPAPVFLAWVVGLVEFLGGIAVLLGVFTRYAATLIAIVMAVAFFSVKLGMGGLPAGDPDIALFAIAVALAIMGPGRWALMRSCSCGAACTCGNGKEEKSMSHAGQMGTGSEHAS